MKLRNKNTGETGYLELEKGDDEKYISFRVYKKDFMYIRYNSLTKLIAEWEEYTPPEPLIKDEKLRKALWVWADENRIKKVGFKLDNGNTLCACYFYDESCEVCEFGLKFYLPIDADKIYTIAELCGK